jgi:hypothetical protein
MTSAEIQARSEQASDEAQRLATAQSQMRAQEYVEAKKVREYTPLYRDWRVWVGLLAAAGGAAILVGMRRG